MRLTFIFIVALIFFQGVSALSVDLKEKYSPEETMIAEVKGVILQPIQSTQVEFRRNNVLIPLEFEIKTLGENTFLWAIAPKNENNYTLSLKGVFIRENGEQKTTSYEKNFSVSGNHTSYNVRPGVISSKKDFQIEINSFVDKEMKIPSNFPEEGQLLLKPGKNTFTFPVSGVEGTALIAIKIGNYVLPAYLTGNSIVVERLESAYFEPSQINRNVVSNKIYTYPLSIINPTNKSLKNLVFALDEEIFLIEPDKLFDLKAGEIKYFNLTTRNSLKNDLDSHISITTDEININLPIKLNVGRDVNITPSNISGEFKYNCYELGGKKCNSGETCSGTSKAALDGECCLNNCLIVSDDSTNMWVGYGLAVVAIGIIAFVWIRYKKAQPSLDIIQKSVEKTKNIP